MTSYGTMFYPGTKMPSSNLNLKVDVEADTKLMSFDISKSLKLKPLFGELASPLYKEVRRYEGYDLCEFFKAQGIDLAKKDLVLFIAKDGFISRISATLILKYRPLLAYRDTTQPNGINWGTVINSNTETDGGPYYLMWGENAKKDIVDNNWPFGVTHFSFANFQNEFKDTIPKHSKYVSGFKIFSQNCANCHTVSGQVVTSFPVKTTGTDVDVIGGASIRGPSFSDIIDSGRTLKQMSDYAKNPQAVYSGARMPPQRLNKSEIKDAIEYAMYMNNKP
jgi:mono/diheme cytochrome c family protein